MNDTNKVAIPLIVNNSGEYLLITRTEYPDHKGEWGPIAGHVKEGETIEEALIREAREELSLEIKPIELIATLDQDIPGDVGFWWTCKVISGEINPNEEIESYKFFPQIEVKKLKLWPATQKFFEEYIWK